MHTAAQLFVSACTIQDPILGLPTSANAIKIPPSEDLELALDFGKSTIHIDIIKHITILAICSHRLSLLTLHYFICIQKFFFLSSSSSFSSFYSSSFSFSTHLTLTPVSFENSGCLTKLGPCSCYVKVLLPINKYFYRIFKILFLAFAVWEQGIVDPTWAVTGYVSEDSQKPTADPLHSVCFPTVYSAWGTCLETTQQALQCLGLPKESASTAKLNVFFNLKLCSLPCPDPEGQSSKFSPL